MSVNQVTIDGVPYRASSTGEINTPASLENLIEYRTSPVATRYTCKTCGALVFWKHDSTWLLDDVHNPSNQEIAKKFFVDLEGKEGGNGPKTFWCVSVGLLERAEDIAKLGFHIFIGDTLDCGLADHIPDVGGKLVRWAGWVGQSELTPKGWKAEEIRSNSGGGDKLHFYCFCGGVEFYITKTSSSKFSVRNCECEICRRTGGFEISSWGRVPLENIYEKKTGEVVVFGGKAPMGMVEYESSVGRKRYFCSGCGALAFLCSGEMVDVAMGLVDQAQDGARAESWFMW